MFHPFRVEQTSDEKPQFSELGLFYLWEHFCGVARVAFARGRSV